MNTPLIKRVKETVLSNTEKKIDMLFETSVNGEKKQETVTLCGEGSIKVLLPV